MTRKDVLRSVERVVAAAILAAAAVLIVALPRDGSAPALGPTITQAICNPDPRATGYLTANGTYNGTSGPAQAGDINSATVYAYISTLNGTNDGGSSGDKDCGNPVYRYGGLLWLTNTTTATINWGAFTANGNSSACYLVYGTNDYMHANWGTTCVWAAGGNPGINYRVLSIALSPANLHFDNDIALDTAGDFEFVWDSCSTFYQSSANTGKVTKTGVPKSDLDNVVGDTTAISWKPGANCGGALTQDGTGTSQSFWYDTTAPTQPGVTNNAGTDSYAASPTATTIWVRGTTAGSITLTPSSTDAHSGIRDYTFAAMAGTTTGWSPTTAVTQTGARTYSWTSSVTDLQSSTIGINATDRAGNPSAVTTITLRGDDGSPTWSGFTAPAAPVVQGGASYTFTWATATDAGAGLLNYEYVKESATLTGSTCGTFGGGTPATQTGTSYVYSGMTTGNCYRMGVRPVDNVGNKAAAYTYSQPIKIGNPPTVAVTDNTGSLTNAYRIGNTVYFGSAGAGSVQLTATGTDATSGIASNTFGALTGTPTGWSPSTAQTNTTNPYSVTYSWTAGAANTSTSVTSRNNLGLDSAATVITFTADGTGPTLSFSAPSAGGPAGVTTNPFTVTFSASDSGAGLGGSGGWSLQRQTAQTAANGCGSFSNDATSGNLVTGQGTVVNQTSQQTLSSGSCYRWVFTGTDAVGNAASVTSGSVLMIPANAMYCRPPVGGTGQGSNCYSDGAFGNGRNFPIYNGDSLRLHYFSEPNGIHCYSSTAFIPNGGGWISGTEFTINSNPINLCDGLSHSGTVDKAITSGVCADACIWQLYTGDAYDNCGSCAQGAGVYLWIDVLSGGYNRPPDTPSHFEASAQPSASIGQAVWFVVSVYDDSGQPTIDPDYHGSVCVSASAGSGAVFPEGTCASLSMPDGVSGNAFRVLFGNTGTHTLTVTGTGIASGTAQVSVTSTSLDATGPQTAYVGIPTAVSVGARDAAGRLIPNYNGNVTFSSSDGAVTWGGNIDTNRQARLSCACDDGQAFSLRFGTVGLRTVTVTDEFGNSDQVQVNVLAAPGAIALPTGVAAYSVQWERGHVFDYYIKNTSGQPLTVVEVSTSCNGGPTQVTAVNRNLTDSYTEFSVRVKDVTCYILGSQSYNWPTAYITDTSGHLWSLNASEGGEAAYRRFSSIPGSSNFEMLDEGDPLAANNATTVDRQYGFVLVPSPAQSGSNFHVVPNGLTVELFAYESTRIVGFSQPEAPFVTQYSIDPKLQKRVVGAGTTRVSFDDLVWACDAGGGKALPSLNVIYTDPASGRDGFRNLWVGYPAGNAPPGYCDAPNGGWDYRTLSGADDSIYSTPLTVDPFAAPFWGQAPTLFGDPVDAFTGSQTAETTDFTLGGLTPSLSLTRSYRSTIADALFRGKAGAHAQQLLFGAGWASLLDTNLEFPSATKAHVRTQDGYYEFNQDTAGAWHASVPTTDTLLQVGGGWKLTHRDGSGFRFDVNGLLAAIFDQNGRELSLTWTSGKLTGLTDAANRSASITTNVSGEITRIDVPGGRYVAYTYDAHGYLTSFRDLGGTVVTYVVDVRGRITAVKNAAADTLLANVFDFYGRVLRQTDALGHATYFNYDDRAMTAGAIYAQDADNDLTRVVIGPRGASTMACFNRRGSLIGEMDPERGIKTWGYDGAGNVVRSTDELGFITHASYDPFREPTSLTDAVGHTTTMTWDAFGHPTTVVAAGTTSTTAFDPTTHLPMSTTNSAGANSQTAATYTYYSGTNLLATTTGPGGAVTTYHYDAYGYVDYVIDPAGRKTTFVTNSNTGLVSSSVDPLGTVAGGVPGDHTTTYTYDDAGRLLTITDPLGNMAGGTPSAHRTTYTYDSFGRLKTESRASGALTTYNYDLAGRLTSVVVKLTGSVDATTSFEYDADGNLTAVVDPESRRTETTFDLAGRPTSVKDPANKVSTAEYDAKGRITATVDATGVRVETTYDGLDRVATTKDGAGKTTTYAYDPTTGLLSSMTDPLNHATQYGYDWLGRQTSVTNAENKTSSIAYDSKGFVASVTNARNKTTSFTYNPDGQLLTVTEPGDSGNFVTTYTYDDGGRLWKRENARGGLDTYEYDALGRPTKLTDAAGKVWRTFYTDDGDIDHTIDGKTQTTTYGYDLAGRLLTVAPASPTPAITYTYDKSDRVLTMADGNGTTTYGYGGAGRLSSVARAGRTTTYTYDDAGRRRTVVYPASQGTVTFGYDTAGRLSTITDWASRLTTYHYDDSSRVSSVDRPGGLTTAYTYDNVDRPLTAVSTRSGSTVLSQGWTYDPNGNIATLTDDTGTASFSYDNLDRLLTAAYPASQTYSYTYDAVGNITQAVTPTGTAAYTYDLADRITSNGPSTPQPASSTRAPSTNNSGWTNSANAYASDNAYATAAPAKNGTTSVRLGTFGFDAQIPANATITNVTVTVEWKVDTTSSIATLGTQVYVSNTARGTELIDSAEPTSDTTESYSVSGLTRADLLNGAFEVQVRASRGNSNTAFTASLDNVSVKVDYTVPGTPAAPTYDDNGNMTSDGSYGNRTYAYDTLGRLTQVTSGGATTTYSLDGSGNRWSQTTGAASTSFDLDLQSPNPTILADGTAKYLAGSPGAGYEAGGTWRNAVTDLIGGPVEYVDTSGATSGLVHYDPYGVPRPGSTAGVGVGYAGEYRDATGLLNLRARSYDPVLGRFIGRDTFAGVASAPQTGNRYAYATANPLRFTDPSGHFVQTIIDNPLSVVEIAMTFNPVGAALVLIR